MAGIATERWTDKRVKQNIDIGAWTATMGWDVVGMTDEDDAVASVPIAQGDPHPISALSFLTCLSVECTSYKLTLATVVATFGVTSLVTAGATPLSDPPLLTWKRGKNSVPVSADIWGNAITDANGQPFQSNAPRNRSVRYLGMEFWEAYYDQDQADEYIDSTNADSVTFEGVTYPPGNMYLLNYAPMIPYKDGCNFVKDRYDIEIRTPKDGMTIGQQRFPFQRRLLNQGYIGWYDGNGSGDSGSTPTPGNVWDSTGTQVSHPVLLGWNGIPLDPSFTVCGLAPIAAPNPITTSDNQITDLGMSVTTGDVYWEYGSEDPGPFGKPVYLIYMDYPELPFNDIVPD